MEETPEEKRIRMIEEQNQFFQNQMVQMTTMMNKLLGERVRAAVPDSRMDDRGLKLEVSEFDGSSMDPEVFLDWERSLERFFEYKTTPEDQKYKLAKLKLSKHASIWFDGIQNQRRREGKAKVQTWSKLKKLLRRRFVPTNYQQQLYIRWSSLRQASKSVVEYLKEFERLSIACEIDEREEMKYGRFVGGLNDDIREKLETHSNIGFDEACKLAITYEKQRKKSKAIVSNSFVAGTDSFGKVDVVADLKSSTFKQREGKQVERKEFKEVRCFKCNGTGHYQKECPNTRALTTIEKQEIYSIPSLLNEDSKEEEEGTYIRDDNGKLIPYN